MESFDASIYMQVVLTKYRMAYFSNQIVAELYSLAFREADKQETSCLSENFLLSLTSLSLQASWEAKL